MAALGQLERIQLEGFLSIRKMDLELRPLNLLIGPNGAGKSNLIKFFRFMGKLLHKDLQIHVRSALGGADAALYFGRKVSERIRIDLSFKPNSYHCVLVPTPTGELVFAAEYGYYYDEAGGRYRFSLARPGSDESGLPWNQPADDRKKRWVVEHIEGWRRYHFDDTSDAARVKQPRELSASDALEEDAGNLAAFLYFLRHPQDLEYRRIIEKLKAVETIAETVQRVSSTFQDFILEPEGGSEKTIRLRWKHRGIDTPFDAFQLSDGTLRFISLATLLLQPEPPKVIVLDEPELGLHPYAIQLLAGMMRSASARTQIVAATQSVTLANQFGPEDLIVVQTRDNASHFERLSPDGLSQWLEEYRMGDLWEKNLIGGTPG